MSKWEVVERREQGGQAGLILQTGQCMYGVQMTTDNHPVTGEEKMPPLSPAWCTATLAHNELS